MRQRLVSLTTTCIERHSMDHGLTRTDRLYVLLVEAEPGGWFEAPNAERLLAERKLRDKNFRGWVELEEPLPYDTSTWTRRT